MPYDEGLAHRIRDALDEREDVSEKKMFGGLAFLVRGNMCLGVIGDELMVRVGPDAYADALRQPHAREMDFTGRPMTGFVQVGVRGLASDASLRRWVARALEFASSLPRK
jgi:TfoX/Sxy family transcriptional regulator of competence genes